MWRSLTVVFEGCQCRSTVTAAVQNGNVLVSLCLGYFISFHKTFDLHLKHFKKLLIIWNDEVIHSAIVTELGLIIQEF